MYENLLKGASRAGMLLSMNEIDFSEISVSWYLKKYQLIFCFPHWI